MQTTWLPVAACDHIDRLQRNFLWGDSETEHKIHLLNWDQVVREKYLHTEDLWNAETKPHHSFTWKSELKGVQLLKKGVR
ncbi:reverse transcriptase [Quillaja saponaria]|uniref:Reverse transcriptase n=1 Tax=Quillaja saponaria TaxID=32244 RepID=A0AAD7L1H3_QUISA|nr:reverse transcriptase [Quillaja saponaria]